MINLYRFYNDIFSKFQFSITGYNNIGKSLDNYFDIIAENSFFFEQNEMLFISFAFAQLKEGTDGLIKWETTSINNQKKFLFHCFHSRQMEVILDLYYTLRSLLPTIIEKGEINEKLPDEATAYIIAKLFNNFPSYRIVASESNDVVMEFEQRKFLWTFHIPIQFCVLKNKNLLDEFNETLKKVTALKVEKQKLSIVKTKNTYEWKSENPSNEYIIIRNEFLKIFDYSIFYSLRKELVNQIKYFQNQHKVFFEENDIEININHWANSIIAGAFLSFVFNAFMEYIPGVANVEEEKNKDGGSKFKSLGAMIIGYDKDKPIDNDLRSLFRIMSDRISSAIAGNYLKNEYERLSTPNLSIQISKCYGIEGIKEITHGNGGHYDPSFALEKAKEQISSLDITLNVLRISNQEINGLSVFESVHNNFREHLDALNEYDKRHHPQILSEFRKKIEIDYIKIKEEIEKISDKIEFIEWQNGDLSSFINPISVLENGLREMITKLFSSDNGGLSLTKIYCTVYSKDKIIPSFDPKTKSSLYEQANYIVFYHKNTDKKLNTALRKPEWLTNHIQKSIKYTGDFYYAYQMEKQVKCFDDDIVEISTDDNEIIQFCNNFYDTQKLKNEDCSSYIVHFKTYRQ